jgi:hypothetical protein
VLVRREREAIDHDRESSGRQRRARAALAQGAASVLAGALGQRLGGRDRVEVTHLAVDERASIASGDEPLAGVEVGLGAAQPERHGDERARARVVSQGSQRGA